MCFCRAQYLMLAVVVLLGLASLLSGCGAKGPLYLPQGERQQQQSAPADAQPATTTEPPTEQQP